MHDRGSTTERWMVHEDQQEIMEKKPDVPLFFYGFSLFLSWQKNDRWSIRWNYKLHNSFRCKQQYDRNRYLCNNLNVKETTISCEHFKCRIFTEFQFWIFSFRQELPVSASLNRLCPNICHGDTVEISLSSSQLPFIIIFWPFSVGVHLKSPRVQSTCVSLLNSHAETCKWQVLPINEFL